MESIPKDSLLKFYPETLQFLRKQYDLDKPGRIEEAIDILAKWLKKQEHFIRKEYPKDYLERTIIISKGSVERAKKKLDSICTYRTLYPEYFKFFDIKNFELLENFHGSFLPKLTKDHYRVYAIKNKIQKNVQNGFLDFYRFFLMQFEYLQAHDYCNGLVFFVDYSEANIMEVVKWFYISDIKHMLDIVKDAYGMRIKGLYFYTESKTIDAFIAIIKQGASAKVGSRIHVMKTLDKVYEHIPKDILPIEYGGQEKPLFELHNNETNDDEKTMQMEFTPTTTLFAPLLDDAVEANPSVLAGSLERFVSWTTQRQERPCKECQDIFITYPPTVNVLRGLRRDGTYFDKMRDICFTEFKDYFEEIGKAGTNENLRQEDSVSGSHSMGVPGTFRNLNVD